jgi:hypothetical protein
MNEPVKDRISHVAFLDAIEPIGMRYVTGNDCEGFAMLDFEIFKQMNPLLLIVF